MFATMVVERQSFDHFRIYKVKNPPPMFVPFCWEILGLLFVFVVFVVASIIFVICVSSKDFFCEKHYLKLIIINIMDREDPQKKINPSPNGDPSDCPISAGNPPPPPRRGSFDKLI